MFIRLALEMASPGNQHCSTVVPYYNCVQCKRKLCYVDAVTRTDLTRIYDTRCYFNVRSKADISQLNLRHGTDN